MADNKQMTDQEVAEQLDKLSKSLDEIKAGKEEAVKRADAAEARALAAEQALAVSKLSTEDQAAFAALSDDDKGEFHKADDAGKKEILKRGADAVAKANRVPDEIQKRMDSLNNELVALKKRDEENAERIRKYEDERRSKEMVAKAQKDLPNLPGTPEAKGAILKSLDKLDEKEREEVTKLLIAGNAAITQTFRPVGSDVYKVAEGSAEAQIDALAKKFAADNKVTFQKAYLAVMDTEEGKALYNQSIRETGGKQ